VISEFDQFLYEDDITIDDGFYCYIIDDPVKLSRTAKYEIIQLWRDCKFKTLRQQADDLLAIPTISAEYE